MRRYALPVLRGRRPRVEGSTTPGGGVDDPGWRGRRPRVDWAVVGLLVAAVLAVALWGLWGLLLHDRDGGLRLPDSVVAVVDTPAERQAGVLGHPLAPGESLAFDLGRARAASFHMSGVSYPLILSAVDDRGRLLGSLLMEPCAAGPCPEYTLDVAARWWIETRVSDRLSNERGATDSSL